MAGAAPASVPSPPRRWLLRSAVRTDVAYNKKVATFHPSIAAVADTMVTPITPLGNCLFDGFAIATEDIVKDPVQLRKIIAKEVDEQIPLALLEPWGVKNKKAFVKFVARKGAYDHEFGDIILALLCATRSTDIDVVYCDTAAVQHISALELRTSFGLEDDFTSAAPHALLYDPAAMHYDVLRRY